MWLGDVQGFDSARDATCVTPLGGATVFVVFLQKLGLVEIDRTDFLYQVEC